METIWTTAQWAAIAVLALLIYSRGLTGTYYLVHTISLAWHDAQVACAREMGQRVTEENARMAEAFDFESAGLTICQYDEETDSYRPVETSH